MSYVPAHPDRLTELLADRATFGLALQEEHELNRLLATVEDGSFDGEEFDRIAAAVDLALGIGSWQPLPDWLRAKIRTDGVKYLSEAARKPNADHNCGEPRRPLNRHRGG